MLLYFRTDECPYCKQFDRDILADSGVSAAIAPAFKVRINPEEGESEHELGKKYGVHGYPSVVLIAKDGAAPVHLSTGIVSRGSSEARTFAGSFRDNLTYGWDAEASGLRRGLRELLRDGALSPG